MRLLREELQLLQEPGSYVGEVVKVSNDRHLLRKRLLHETFSEPVVIVSTSILD